MPFGQGKYQTNPRNLREGEGIAELLGKRAATGSADLGRDYLPAATISSAISRNLNFCTFIEGVMGKSSTKNTRLGTL